MSSMGKYILFFLFATHLVIHATSRSIQYGRVTRQVVQPTWLAGKDNSAPTDGKVYVTKERLDEVAALRQSIQDAVDNEEYAVDAPQAQSATSIPQSGPSTNAPTTSAPTIVNLFGADTAQQAAIVAAATTAWNDFVSEIHQRMAVIFPPAKV